jgi:hypothetical protein
MATSNMGNYGNTLDRWYHRAAVVVWPRTLAFANRAEPAPAWALERLTAMASDGDVAGARAAGATLTPFWDMTVRGRRRSTDQSEISELFGGALRAGHAVADPASATTLLGPFCVEDLTIAEVSSLLELITRYGQAWTMELLATWSDPERRVWPYPHFVREQGDSIVALEMSVLRAAATRSPGKAARHGNAGCVVLADDCATRLRSRLDRPFRAHDDWSIELPGDGCACELCRALRRFLADPSRSALDWPLAEQGRTHVQSRIDGAELPVTHEIRRQGRPYTLVLTKTDELFTADLQRRSSATPT